MFIRFDIIHERDRRTDGQTDGHCMTAIAALMHWQKNVKRPKRVSWEWRYETQSKIGGMFNPTTLKITPELTRPVPLSRSDVGLREA